jgi:hypothetical protein
MTGSIEELQRMELAAGDEISHADITARIPEVWAAQIEARAEIERVFAKYCKINTDLVGRAGDTIKIPRRAYVDLNTYHAEAQSELVSMTQNFELELETVTLTPTEMGISGRISKQAIDEAMISLVNDTQAGLALAMADKQDQDILTALMATAVSGGPKYVNAKKDATTFTSGDYTTAFAGAAITGVTAADVLDLSVIVEASEVIMPSNGFKADTLFIHPRQKASLLRSEDFINAARAGATSARSNASVANVWGLEVVSSRRVPTHAISGSVTGYQAILIDSKNAVALAYKRPITVETEYKPAERMYYFYVTSMYQAKRLNDGAVVIINSA